MMPNTPARTRNGSLWLIRLRRLAGFSLTEMVITIAILGILSGVVIIFMQGAYDASVETMAESRLETMNRALYQYAQQANELYVNPAASATDEMAVLRTLQYRNPDEDRARLGSPFVSPCFNPQTSSVTSDYRLRWTGRNFELLRPGKAGTGLRLVFDGSDLTEPYEFGPNFESTGS